MANAKRCDRCGKFYMNDDSRFKSRGIYVDYISLISKNGSVIDKYDLCNNCLEHLVKWLDNETE